jgi:hypothetical protein
MAVMMAMNELHNRGYKIIVDSDTAAYKCGDTGVRRRPAAEAKAPAKATHFVAPNFVAPILQRQWPLLR